MHERFVFVVCVVAIVAACQAGGPYPPSSERAAPAASEPSRPDVPTGAPDSSTESGSTEGPHEGTRANTPPGKSRDGQPPVGGAIVDPSGAVTGQPPPPGTR